MSDEFQENLIASIQRFLPFVTSVLWVLVSYLPLDTFTANNLRPDVGLTCVFFWTLYRPDVFNLFSVYLLGLVVDIVTSAPFGSNVFSFLVMYLLVSNLAAYFTAKPFVVTWYGFALFGLITMLARWLLVSVYYSQFLPLPMLMFSVLATIACYPVIGLVNAFIENVLMKDED